MRAPLYTLLIATLLSTVSCRHNNHDSYATPDMTVDVAMPKVDSVVLYKTYPGYLTAMQSVDLVARVNGYLVSHPYPAGSFVKKGTVLFKIESGNYSDAVKQAEASLANARSAYQYASSRYAAMQEALKSDAVSRMEVLQAKSALDDAAANIANSEAALKTARTQLGYCTVRAPFDGHVSTITVDNGAYLAGEAQPVKLATIYDDACLNANFSIEDSRYLELIKEFRDSNNTVDFAHMPVNFSEKLPHSYTADLSYLAPNIDRSTGTLRIKATIENPYNDLRDGMYCTVALPYATDPRAILIDDASIATDQLGQYVYTVNDSDKIVYTPIKTGATYGDSLRIVTSGLTPESRYVTKALLKVRDGQKVTPRMVK